MQAARGASLSDADTPDTPPVEPSPRPRRVALLAAVAVAAYAVDVVTKMVVVAQLTGHPDVPVLGRFLVLHLTRNAGAAFSTGTSYTVLLSLVALVALGVVVFLGRRVRSAGWAFAMGLLAAGIAGNLTDRIFRSPAPLRGHVVDFLMLPHWPVFNVADMCINVAAALILLQAWRGIRLDGSRTREKGA